MIRRPFRRGLTLGLLGAAATVVVRTVQSRRLQAEPAAPANWAPIPDTTPVTVPAPAVTPVVEPVAVAEPVTEPRPKPDPAVNLLQEAPEPKAKKKAAAKKETKKKAKAEPWVEPVDGACPGTHPVKGKLTSKIFHLPGGFNYPRTIPDRCYIDAAAAEADGLRASKR
ncbi:MAG: hypothetical protein JWN67_3601 [Actinomycetia bacterium]|nr:hypothetical protein [Actinomycetes bacterium]